MSEGTVEIDHCTKADFDFIRTHVVDVWGSDQPLPTHHPIFLYEFGDTAYVIREGGNVLAYLFGFFAQTEPTAYVQFIGVHPQARRKGLAGRLYARFESDARAHGCTALKAITNPDNSRSIAFHRSIGMSVDLVPDYAGPGQDRAVFRKALA
jgi:ribosomal protein S18 acetylase RimI-like enzyme